MGLISLIRLGIVGIGLLIALAGFWFQAGKKLTSDLAVVWCLLGLAVAAVGAIPMLSRWIELISVWTGIALVCVGAACLLGAFRICMMISKLVTENQELAMMVSLLLAEREEQQNEAAAEIEENLRREKPTVCN